MELLRKSLQLYKEHTARKEEEIIEINRQDYLDLSDMSLPDLKREHFAVKQRLVRNLYDPEGLELLQERENNLLLTIKHMRRRKK